MTQPTVLSPAWALLLLLAYPLVLARTGRRPPARVGWLILYAVGVVAVTVFPIVVRPGHRLGEAWWTVLRWVPFEVPPVGFVLNVVMFVPFGVLVPLLWPRAAALGRLTLWGLTASAGIELTQFVLWVTVGNRRTVDVNDLIANTGGAVLGLLALRAVTRRRRRQAGVQARM